MGREKSAEVRNRILLSGDVEPNPGPRRYSRVTQISRLLMSRKIPQISIQFLYTEPEPESEL